MSSVLEIGGSIISRSIDTIDRASHNIANATTPGFKALLIDDTGSSPVVASLSNPSSGQRTAFDHRQGNFVQTGTDTDLAIAGPGYFTVRSEAGIAYTRDGRFVRDADGRLVTSDGLVLQSDAGDLAVSAGDFTVLSDGIVLAEGQPIAKLRIVDADADAMRGGENARFTIDEAALRDAEPALVRQGMIEASNISFGSEMVTIMAALRRAEAGQRVIQVNEDLMRRAIEAFRQS